MTKPSPAPIPPSEEHQELQPVQNRYVAIHRQLLRESGWWATRKKEISLITRVAVTLLLFAFLLKSVSWSTLGAILAQANRATMLLGLGVGAFSLVLSSAQWQSLLRAERITSGISKLIRLNLVGIAFNHFLPGGIGGEAVKALYVSRESGNGAGSVCAVVMSRFTGFFGMLLVALPVLIIWLSHFTSTLVAWFVLLSLLIGCVFCGAIFSTTLVSRVAKGSWINNHLTSHRILDAVVRIGNAIRISARRPHSLCVALVFGVLFWVTSCLNYYIYGIALHLDVPLYFYFVAIPLVALVTLLPISINGFGVRESAFVYIFSTVHVLPATSLLLAFVVDGQMLLFGVLGGYMYLTMSGKATPRRSPNAEPGHKTGTGDPHIEAKATKQPEDVESRRPMINEPGQSYAIYDFNHSRFKKESLPSKYLVTIPFGIGDTILYGLTAVDQIVRCLPGSKGRIDVLCGTIQAEIFKYDHRISKVIIVDDMKQYSKDIWKRILFSSEKDELLRLIKEKHYEAVFPGNINFSLFHQRYTDVMRLNLFDIVKDYLALRKLEDAPVTRRVRAIINKYFKTVGSVEQEEEGIPLYLNTELLIQAEQRVDDIRRSLSLPKNGKLLIVAPDASHEVTRPSTRLLFQGINNALNSDPFLGVCILPSYTDRNASRNLEEQLALEHKEHIYSFPSEPRPSLLFLAAFIDQADILITGDTAIMHLAAAKKTLNESEQSSISPKNLTKIIALFGGTNPGFFGHSERTKILGRGRSEQKKVRPGIGKEGYDPKGRDFFDHISPRDLSQAILN